MAYRATAQIFSVLLLVEVLLFVVDVSPHSLAETAAEHEPINEDGAGISATSPPRYADFVHERASVLANTLANWVVSTDDHQGAPFVLVDKVQARVYVFNKSGRLQGASSALLGLTPGDTGVAGIGDRPLALISPLERTTPSGRFVAALAQNKLGQEILWVDYEQSISLHPLRSVDAKERRLERLLSDSAADNRISYGCINVSAAFWRDVVLPAFQGTIGVVYVMPETRPLHAVFPMPLALP